MCTVYPRGQIAKIHLHFNTLIQLPSPQESVIKNVKIYRYGARGLMYPTIYIYIIYTYLETKINTGMVWFGKVIKACTNRYRSIQFSADWYNLLGW